MDKKIQKFLDQNEIKYQAIRHRKIYTAFNAAETQKTNPKEITKTVLVNLGKQIAFLKDGVEKIEKFSLVLVAIPAGKHLDFKKIDKFILDTQTKLYAKLIKTNPKLPKPIKVKTSIAKEKDIAGKLKTKYLLTPLPVYGIPLLLDKKLALNKNLIFSAGSFTQSVKIPTKQYVTKIAPITGNFSK